MKSRTSFFNATVLRKDITRYAPVWGLYTIGLLLFLLIPDLGSRGDSAASSLCYAIPSMAIVNGVLGAICAFTVFGDLFKTRLCYATHALPLRREGWFFTHFTAGFLFSFVPNLLLTLLFLPVLKSNWHVAFLWLAVTTLQFLFFFGAGALCAVVAGNRLGAVAAYCVLNFGLMLIEWYADSIYTPLLYGVEYRWSLPTLLMPFDHLRDLDYVICNYKPFQIQSFITADWLYLSIVAAIGLVFAVFAILIYRKRDLETAGDFLSLRAAKPVFLLTYTLAFGYLLSTLVSPDVLGLFVGILVGFFTGKMLLERTVKVFKGWNFLRFGILITLLALSIVTVRMDFLGLNRYVPDTENIASMHFYSNSEASLYQDDDHAGWTITDPDEINQFRQIHENLADGRYRDTTEKTVSVYFLYELKNGRTVLRSYEVPVHSEYGKAIGQQLSRWESVFQINNWEAFTSSVEELMLEIQTGAEYGHFTLTQPEQVQGLLEAMKADCDAGTMGQNWSYHDDEETYAWLYIYDSNFYKTAATSTEDSVGYANMVVYSISLNIWESCQNTLDYIESLNLQLESYDK